MGPGILDQLPAHRGRDVADAELGLDVRVVELADEGVRPRLAGVDGDVHVVLPVPLPPLLPSPMSRSCQRNSQKRQSQTLKLVCGDGQSQNPV